MINYSIPKPHPLVGHFIQINSQQEYDRMKVLAEGCGFREFDYYREGFPYHLRNAMEVRWHSVGLETGQEITLDELEQLVELSKIKLPQVMELTDKSNFTMREAGHVIDFYKGQAVLLNCDETYTTRKHFRPINPHQAEIDKLEIEIKAAQAKLETLKNAK